MIAKCASKVVQHDVQYELEERPVDASGVVVPCDLCEVISKIYWIQLHYWENNVEMTYLVNLGDELGIILIQDSPDHGSDGVHYPHPVLLQVSVRLHVAKVLRLHTRVSGKKAESNIRH